jgi:type III pantothenate kinase
MNGELCGVLICPGVRSALDSLSANAAELPEIALEQPKGVFGKNTIDAMTAGTIIGNAAMIDGLLDRIAAEWDLSNLNVIVTGEYAEWIIPYCRSSHQIQHEPNLTLYGLKLIHQLNDRHKPV